jgi:hypothetical protein
MGAIVLKQLGICEKLFETATLYFILHRCRVETTEISKESN